MGLSDMMIKQIHTQLYIRQIVLHLNWFYLWLPVTLVPLPQGFLASYGDTRGRHLEVASDEDPVCRWGSNGVPSGADKNPTFFSNVGKTTSQTTHDWEW